MITIIDINIEEIHMQLFRIFSVSENKYITDTNEWMIDIEGHPCSLYSDPESDPDITMREDCIVEWNTGYIDHRGHQIYAGDVFFDENDYAMVALWYNNMWVFQIWGWDDDGHWGEIDILPMDDFEFDDLVVAGDYHSLGDEVYKGAAVELHE